MDQYIKLSIEQAARSLPSKWFAWTAISRYATRLCSLLATPHPVPYQEILKEISIMQSCDCENIVKYFGSYFHKSDLWVSLLCLDSRIL